MYFSTAMCFSVILTGQKVAKGEKNYWPVSRCSKLAQLYWTPKAKNWDFLNFTTYRNFPSLWRFASLMSSGEISFGLLSDDIGISVNKNLNV